MSTATHLGGDRYRHRESMSLPAYASPRARTLDASGVARVIDREVARALRPFKAEIQKAERQVDAIRATNAAIEAKLAPLMAVRDALKRESRKPTPAEVNAANHARYGRDAEGRHSGDPNFGLDTAAVRDAAVGATSPAGAINAMNRKRWGRA